MFGTIFDAVGLGAICKRLTPYPLGNEGGYTSVFSGKRCGSKSPYTETGKIAAEGGSDDSDAVGCVESNKVS